MWYTVETRNVPHYFCMKQYLFGLASLLWQYSSIPVMNGHPRDEANVSVQGRWPLTTGIAQGRYYCSSKLGYFEQQTLAWDRLIPKNSWQSWVVTYDTIEYPSTLYSVFLFFRVFLWPLSIDGRLVYTSIVFLSFCLLYSPLRPLLVWTWFWSCLSVFRPTSSSLAGITIVLYTGYILSLSNVLSLSNAFFCKKNNPNFHIRSLFVDSFPSVCCSQSAGRMSCSIVSNCTYSLKALPLTSSHFSSA